MKKNKTRTIAFKIFIRSVAILLIALSVMLLCFDVYFKDIMTRRSHEDQMMLTKQGAANIENLLIDFKRSVYYLCADHQLAQMLSDDVSTTEKAGYADSLNAVIGKYTGASLFSADSADYRMLFLVSGQFENAVLLPQIELNDKRLRKLEIYAAADSSCEEKDWYIRINNSQRALCSFLTDKAPSYLFFGNAIYSTARFNPNYSGYAGTVLFIVRQSTVHRMLSSIRYTSNSSVFMLNDDLIVSTLDSEEYPAGALLSERTPDLYERICNAQNGSIHIDGREYYLSSVSVYRDWHVACLTPMSDILSPRHMPIMILTGALVVLLTGVVIAIIISYNLSRPIMLLSEHMAAGDIEDPGEFPLKTNTREVIQLWGSYKKLLSDLRQLMSDNEKEIIRHNQARMRALQAQINPHFIYNTLDAINCIALVEDSEQISNMAVTLIDIMKYCMRFTNDTAALKAEKGFLDSYLSIQRIRFGEHFEVIDEIPSEFDRLIVPKVTLQPLVENCIYHAYTSGHHVVIRLRIFIEENTVRLCVEDNGERADPERLNAFLNGMPVLTAKGEGIGIINVNERTRLCFGTEYGLHYEAAEAGGTLAVVTMPLRFEKETHDDGNFAV